MRTNRHFGLLCARLEPSAHLHAPAVAQYGQCDCAADIVVIETARQAVHAVDRLSVHRQADVSSHDRTVRLLAHTPEARGGGR